VCANGFVYYCEEVVEAEGVDGAESYAGSTTEAPVIVNLEDAFRVPGHGAGWSRFPQSFPPYPLISHGQ